MPHLIYGSCAVTAFLCCWLLFQAYRSSKYRLLLWGCLCFLGLTLNNVLLVLDKIVLPEVDLSLWRQAAALAAAMVLLYGLIWDTE